jgi:hypothetical protein
MPEQDFDTQLKETITQWLTKVYEDLNLDFARTLMSLSGEHWSTTEDGSLYKLSRRVFFNPRLIDEVLFQKNGFWPQVEELARQSSAINLYIGRMIGSQHGMRRSYSLQELFRLILPVPKLLNENQIYLNLEENPQEVVDRFLAELQKTTVTTNILWPITGLAVDNPLILDDRLTFRELTPEEKVVCLNFGMIASDHDEKFTDAESRWYCLVLTTEDNKFASEDTYDHKAVIQNFEFQQEALEDFLICACLVADTPVSHGGGQAHAPSVELSGIFSGGTVGRGVRSSNIHFMIFDSFHKVAGDDRQRFTDVWRFIRGQGRQKGFRQIVNAARRFYYASTRHNAGDILVDLMIAAESLYLDGQDKGELSYRLSLNAALWESDDAGRQGHVFELFRKAYSLRSKIVHGASYDAVSVAEVCNEVRPLIKKAISKAFTYMIDGERMPKWESLLFPNTQT